jgi:hypothetical protein
MNHKIDNYKACCKTRTSGLGSVLQQALQIHWFLLAKKERFGGAVSRILPETFFVCSPVYAGGILCRYSNTN